MIVQQTMEAARRYAPTHQEASCAHVQMGMHWVMTTRYATVSGNMYTNVHT